MRKTLSAIALLASLWPMEASAAHCRLGLLYRPSRGICVTPRAFEREVGSPRRASRWERHRGRRFRMLARPSRRDRDAEPAAPEVRAAALPRPEAVPAVPAVVAPPPATPPVASRKEVRAILPELPYVVNGNLSLNPMPRWGGDLTDMPRRAPAAR